MTDSPEPIPAPAAVPAPGPVVVVGASLAGGTTALELRRQGYGAGVTLVGEEEDAPYERPLLSKGYLRGTHTRPHLALTSDRSWRDRGIELVTGRRVTRLLTDEHAVLLQDGTRLGYGTLVLCTGATARRPSVPGACLPGVHVLRTRADADRLRAAVRPGRRALVVGLGLVGAECAATLVGMGVQVTAVDPFPHPLARAVPPAVGAALARRHTTHGVRLRPGRSVVAIHGTDRVGAVELDDGEWIEADMVLAGLGADPATQVVRSTDVQVGVGVRTDPYGRTSAPDVYAAGDVVEQWVPHLGRHQRVEHWRRALQQARALAATLAGLPSLTDDASWFWTEQYDLHLEVAGDPLAPNSRLVLEGDLDDGPFLVRCLVEGRTVGVVGAGRGRAVKAVARELTRDLAPATPRAGPSPVPA